MHRARVRGGGAAVAAGFTLLVASASAAASACGAFSSDEEPQPDAGATESGSLVDGDVAADAATDTADAGPQLRVVFARSFGSASDAGEAGATMAPPSMVVDPGGGATLLGSYAEGAVDLGNGALLPVPSAEDVYIARIDGAGAAGAFKAFGGATNLKNQRAAALAGSGASLFAAVEVEGTMEFAPGIFIASEGNDGAFNGGVARFDGALTPFGEVFSGMPMTARGNHNVLTKRVAGGPAGSVFVFGDWEDSVSINGTSSRQRDPGTTGLFLGRFYALSGADVFETDYCPMPTTCTASALASNAATGEVVAGGRFSGKLGPGGTPPLTAAGDDDAFLMKLDPVLTRMWTLAISGAGTQQVHAITSVPQSRDFIAAGTFDGTLVVPGGASVPSQGQSDVFVLRVDAGGGVVWMKTFGGPGIDRVNAVAADAAGNVFLAGDLTGPSLAIGSTTLANADVTGRGTSDGFVAWLDGSGAPLYAARFGDGGNDHASALGVTATGDVVVAGTFEGAIDFSAGAAAPLRARGRTDTFVARLAR